MSRKNRHPNARRKRRERLREQQEERLRNAPQAPARMSFLGKVRSGDEAVVSLDFRGAPRVDVDFESAEDPGEAAREALLADQWASQGHPTKGSS